MAIHARLAHMGIYVHDRDKMERFYTEVLGLMVTDHGEGRAGMHLTFMSGNPKNHHQFVLVTGRPDTSGFNPIQQMSFMVDSLADLREVQKRALALGATEMRPVSHGNAWSIYFKRIEAKGEGEIKAGDIKVGPNVEILNPEQHIATLSKEGKLDIDLTIKVGRGYVPAERNKDETAPVGTIPIDSIFSPIRKVNYTVTNARVGQRTDYDRLNLEIWTDGSVRPDDAVAFAARILQDQLAIFINFEETAEPAETAEERHPSLNENLFRSVAELELSVRSANCLQNAGIKYIGELVQKSEA